MKRTKYICPLCKRSSILQTRCTACMRTMIEVCAACEKPIKKCICEVEKGVPPSPGRKRRYSR
ncbi:MAG: hypothetical protein ACE5PM_09525 [Candidatus Hydrothermarchaeales archaeon]